MEFDINLVVVVGAALGAYVVGALWYSVIFRKRWMAEMGYVPERMTSMRMSPEVSMALGFVTTLLMSYVMAHFIAVWGEVAGRMDVFQGFHLAFFLWLGFVMPLTMGVVLWDNKSWALFAINTTHYLVAMLVMGGILGYFA